MFNVARTYYYLTKVPDARTDKIASSRAPVGAKNLFENIFCTCMTE